MTRKAVAKAMGLHPDVVKAAELSGLNKLRVFHGEHPLAFPRHLARFVTKRCYRCSRCGELGHNAQGCIKQSAAGS
jgi:hypothetical protein